MEDMDQGHPHPEAAAALTFSNPACGQITIVLLHVCLTFLFTLTGTFAVLSHSHVYKSGSNGCLTCQIQLKITGVLVLRKIYEL